MAYKVHCHACTASFPTRESAIAAAATAAISGVKGMAKDSDAAWFAKRLMAAAEESGTAKLEFYGSSFGRGSNPGGCLSCWVEMSVVG